ncbi:MAG: hypothetical protein H6651_16740 [Ardenticatenales bacterium]|nr:hypothetical protein [Ardenticatenales bacterium]
MRVAITLELPSGEIQTVQLPDDVSMDRLVPALVGKLGLPLVDGAGQSLHYDLLPPGGSPLASAQTLADIGLGPAARLRLRAQPLAWENPAQATPPSTPGHLAAPPRPGQPINPLDAHLHQPARRPNVTYESAADSDDADSSARNALGFILFLIYLGIRLIGFVLDSGSDSADQISAPVVTRQATVVPTVAAQTLPTLSPFPTIPVDSPVLLDNMLYYLYEDEAGYALWRLDLSDEASQPLRLAQVFNIRGQSRHISVIDGVLYVLVGSEREIWHLPAGAQTLQPYTLDGHNLHDPPLALGEHRLFSGPGSIPIVPLYAAQAITRTQAITLGTGTPAQFVPAAIRSTEVITLPVLVSRDWQANQVVFDGNLYFAGRDAEGGLELWRTDGTVSGTSLVRDINLGLSGSTPQGLVAATEYIYFSALNDSAERELWRSDGTSSGTEQVTDLRGSQGAYPEHLMVIDGELFFSALTGVLDRSLLHLQGTAEKPTVTPAGYDARGTLVEDQIISFAGQLAFLVEESSRTLLVLYDPLAGESRRVWRQQERLLAIHDAGNYLLARNSRGVWYRLAANESNLERLDVEMGAVVAVVPEPAGTSLLVDQQAYLWRLDADGELHFLANLAGTN